MDYLTNALPLLPLKNIVLLPGMIVPIFIEREKSLRALTASIKAGEGAHVLFTSQKMQENDDPKPQDLFETGVLTKIIQTVKLPNNNIKVIVEVLHRVKLESIQDSKDFFASEYTIKPDEPIENLEHLDKVMDEIIKKFSNYANLNKKISSDSIKAVADQKNPGYAINVIISHLTCKPALKQELLELTDISKRAEALNLLISDEITNIEAAEVVQSKTKQRMEKNQRDYFLSEQMKVIQQELHSGDDKSELNDLEKKIKEAKLSTEAREKAESELKKLRTMGPMSAEASIVRNFIDTLINLPWEKTQPPAVNITKASEILDRDHYGLEKIKERVIEYLAVLQRSKKIKGPILCFVGPPGVGKTSLVKSIAEAVGRKYAKFALGGVRDESEIRGHRRTYLGAMPGKIITLIKKHKVNNPVMLLDEIDKMSSDYRGDPASALLEALDPEQNKAFVDHYMEVEYDLSDVMFIATANSLNLPRPLLDRMEVIRISGYVEEEKLQITKNYLIPKQLKEHSIKDSELIIPDQTIMEIIRYYTKESGVRNLEREIGALARKSLRKILDNKKIKSITVNPEDLEEYLGVKKFKFGLAEEEDQVGATTGLAYTEVGGELLTVEAVKLPGKGEIKATGKLGDVMKESTQAAFSYFRSRLNIFGLKNEDCKDTDIHLHVPEGATPKDGPSAGIAIFTTIVSLMTGIAVKKTVAMTGEITLRGHVLPIGGLKEKLLAASRGGIKTVIIPTDNIKDLKDIPSGIKSQLEIIPVTNSQEVLEIALTKPPAGLANLKATKTKSTKN